MASGINNILVFQGEVAVANNQWIQTSTPTSCSVIAVNGSSSPIGALAHVDDFTNVYSIINTLTVLLKRDHQKELSADHFNVRVMGGNNDKFSIEQRRLIHTAFQKLGITITVVSLPDPRPCIALHTGTGQLEYSYDTQIDRIQGYEYGCFKISLENDIKSKKIKYSLSDITFEAKVASRTLETLAIKPERKLVLSSVDSIKKIYAIASPFFKGEKALGQAYDAKNYELMLRRAAVTAKTKDVVTSLKEHASSLEILLASRGEKSGTAWDVAEAKGNKSALQILNQIEDTP